MTKDSHKFEMLSGKRQYERLLRGSSFVVTTPAAAIAEAASAVITTRISNRESDFTQRTIALNERSFEFLFRNFLKGGRMHETGSSTIFRKQSLAKFSCSGKVWTVAPIFALLKLGNSSGGTAQIGELDTSYLDLSSVFQVSPAASGPVCQRAPGWQADG
ncbi:hypothetical protein [Novosphingobium aquae]|uniref:Uncharacterized protein n=1 Tax=Novosphingobium aquae TaxID=3133435 RepID=A0ABU8SDW2_9SPHN